MYFIAERFRLVDDKLFTDSVGELQHVLNQVVGYLMIILHGGKLTLDV